VAFARLEKIKDPERTTEESSVPLTPSRTLNERVVVVTGATSGIGRSTVDQLIKHGARVTAVGRRKERLEAILDTFGADCVLPLAVDVRTSEGNKQIIKDTIAYWGKIDSIVVNAGIGIYGGILEATDEELVDMLETNLHASVWAFRAAIPEFLARGGGDIVLIASVAGLRGGAHEAVYAATKFGQIGLAGAVDREYHSRGIRISTICPSGVATEFAIGTGRTENMPEMTTWLQPDDIARSVLFALQQPRSLRASQITIWSAGEAG
jgi:3-oxoacyl-[acyl-carrier protein] reductase